ncbi:hypothetical protein [Mycoplasma mycoides]|uniref:hypothetical protein n=1 Tax=Mycoplasma mycoides TaxID=2102 RepID=UPI00223F91BC|nr:hypothetical protein [Mycoplasma mycoides]QVK06090.1 hypothetical protein I7641_00455 [Mycoplasma mycoides subsp. capri]
MINSESNFVSLAPIIINKSDAIYDKTLDFPLSKEEKIIMNVVISEPYGSEKSTFQKTY